MTAPKEDLESESADASERLLYSVIANLRYVRGSEVAISEAYVLLTKIRRLKRRPCST